MPVTQQITPVSVLGVVINVYTVAVTFLLSDQSVEQTIIRDNKQAICLAKKVYSGATLTRVELKALFEMSDLAKALQTYCEGGVTISRGKVYYGDEELHNGIVDKILAFYKAGDDFSPLSKFLGKLFGNPSARAVKEFYEFTLHVGMAIAPDGDVYGYKAVKPNFTDLHTGTVSNKPGESPELPRNKVDDDANRGCSYGYHVGSFNYANEFGNNIGLEGGDHLMLVKFNPSDVVSVPHDSSHQKVRVCKYTVVGELKSREALTEHLLNDSVASSKVKGENVYEIEDSVEFLKYIFGGTK